MYTLVPTGLTTTSMWQRTGIALVSTSQLEWPVSKWEVMDPKSDVTTVGMPPCVNLPLPQDQARSTPIRKLILLCYSWTSWWRKQKTTHLCTVREAFKLNLSKNLVFCPNWGGGSANPKFWFNFSKGVFVAIWLGFPSPNQQNHQKSHKKSPVTQKVWLFHEKMICLE